MGVMRQVSRALTNLVVLDTDAIVGSSNQATELAPPLVSPVRPHSAVPIAHDLEYNQGREELMGDQPKSMAVADPPPLQIPPAQEGSLAEKRTRRIQVIDLRLKVFDVVFKSLIAVVATWWAINSFGVQQERTDKNIRAQLETQRESARSQREMQEAMLIAALIERLKCQGDQEQQMKQLMALKLVRAAAPTFSPSLSEVLMGCATTPLQKQIIEEFSDESSRQEMASRFLGLVADARQSRRFGLSDEAALEEFEAARSKLPKPYEKYFDEQELAAARASRREGRLAEASDHYERAFRRIDTSSGINALPLSVPRAK